MGIINLLLTLSPALEAGRSISKASAWANITGATHALVVIFGFILLAAKVFGYDIPLTDDQIAKLAGAIASIGGTIFGIASVTTNPNAGFMRK